MKKRFGFNRFIASCMAVLMIFSMLPVSAFAAEQQTPLGKVRVIVENTVYSKADGASWDGTLVDKEVDIHADSTMMSAAKEAIESSGFTQKGAESNYISSINGLAAFDGGRMSGWMGTLNDWFTNAGFGNFTVAAGTLQAGDEICLMYTKKFGEDVGGSWGNTDKSLKALNVSVGTLSPAFSPKTKAYTLTLPAGTSVVKVVPTAANKNFQVRVSVDGTEYKRSAQIPVQDGTEIKVKCGDPSWSSMNSANDIPAEEYTIAVKIEKKNTAPYWDQKYPATQSTSIKLGESFSLKSADVFHFRDAEEDALTYNVSVNGEEPAAVETNKDGIYQLTPKSTGTYTLYFTANDGKTNSADGFTVTLNINDKAVPQPTNHPPVLQVSAQSAQSIVLGNGFSLDLSRVFTDVDGDALTYKVSVNGAAYVPAEKTYSFKPTEQGRTILRFQANDGTADSTDTYQVTLQTTSGDKVSQAYAATGNYLYNTVSNPTVGSVGGEWAVIGLARSGFAVNSAYYNKYVSNVINALQSGNGTIGSDQCTDYARVTLALTAIGYNVKNVAGYNLLEHFSDYNKDIHQGINGPVWALIALDSHSYAIPKATAGKMQATRENLVEAVLDAQLPDGGWAFFGSQADPDMTGMALQALAPYYNNKISLRMENRLVSTDSLTVRIKNAVNKAVALLSEMQNTKGGFASWGTDNAESVAQVIVALTALQINPAEDKRFVKNENSLIDNLCSFAVEGGGFRHTTGDRVNEMATEQAYYALVAYQYYKNNQKPLYDMGDIPSDEQQPYKAVVILIDSIGDVTVDKAATVKAARTAYDKLSASAKEQVSNYQKLLDAEKKLAELMKNVEAVQKLIAEIGTVTLEKEQQIQRAVNAYNALSKEERQTVANYELLEKAELKFTQLKHVDSVVKLIDKIGTVTRTSLAQITAARTAYEKLDQLEKALVNNYVILTKAENTYSQYQHADKVAKLISAIGHVSKNSAGIIQAARVGYNALSAEEKTFVMNYGILLAAEKEFVRLQKQTIVVANGGLPQISAQYNATSTVQQAQRRTHSGSVTAKNMSKSVVAAQSVNPVISAISSLTASSNEHAVLAAYRQYSSLSAEQQRKVSNYAVLRAELKRLSEANHKDASTGIQLEGAAWNVKLSVQTISSDQMQKAKQDFGSNTLLSMYQLTLTDILTGKEVQSTENLTVAVPVPAGAEKYKKLAIGQYDDTGRVQYSRCTVKNGTAVWKTKNPHRFALLACAEESTAKLAVKAAAASTGVPNLACANMIVWIAVASLAAGVIIIIAVVKIRKRKVNE
ncbi:MAG: DUF4430 domain-containing protein [Ruminococcaceae bacterium]|nr:DUF4430 domain-containing protein [Oscillospiraceae bacterium]